jgi:hypothetical protein
MTDLDLMITLQRANRDTLGFIPDSELARRYLAGGQYLISTHRHAGKIGMILFERPRRYHALHIAQTCLEYDYRRRQHAADLVSRLCKIGTDAGCSEIRLRCAVANPANEFWRAIGARLTRTTPPRTRQSQPLNHYVIDLQTLCHPLFFPGALQCTTSSEFLSSRPACNSAEPNVGWPHSPPASTPM